MTAAIIITAIFIVLIFWFHYRLRKYPLSMGIRPLSAVLFPSVLLSKPVISLGNSFLKMIRRLIRPKGVKSESVHLLSECGTSVEVTLYTPDGHRSPMPCLVYFHGGGFCFEDAGYQRKIAAYYASTARCKVAFVHYSPSIRHPFPAAFLECCAALKYIWENHLPLEIDPGRIAVGGDSAGGALASACAVWARDSGKVELAFQMLIYPVLDMRMSTGSMLKYTDSPVWNARLNRRMWQLYLPCAASARLPICYASPALVENFSGLPPAYIEVEEYDCLHDEGRAYAGALSSAGVNVQLEDVKGSCHGFDILSRARITRKMLQVRSAALRRCFNT